MFTGIVENKVKVNISNQKNKLLELSFVLPKGMNVKIGDSVSVSGCCLTVASKKGGKISFQIMEETMEKTKFGKFLPEEVNIERSLLVGDSLGGHIVTGHVDCVGIVQDVKTKKEQKNITIKFPKKFSDFVLQKGSVCVDGVSLTISKCTKDTFTVSLIPHTLKVTTLDSLKKTDCVNLEFDIVSKHIVKLIKK